MKNIERCIYYAIEEARYEQSQCIEHEEIDEAKELAEVQQELYKILEKFY